MDPPAGAQDRPCPDMPVGILFPHPGTKSAPMGFLELQTQLGLMICARQSSAHIIDNYPEAPLRHAPPTEHDGACNRRDACELNLQRHSNI